MIQEGIFTIEYERGRMRINLSAVLPCPKTEFKKILSAVDLAADPAAYADELNNYIRQQYEAAKQREESETWIPNKKAAAQEAKKYTALNDSLVKRYGCAALEDAQSAEEQPKMKKSIVYAFCAENGKQIVKPYLNGYSFRIAGYDFSVFRKDAKDLWHILLSESGVQCAEVYKKTEVIDAVREILPKIEQGRERENYKDMKARFTALMIEAGYKNAMPEGSLNDERAEVISKQPCGTNGEKSTADENTIQDSEKNAMPETISFCGKNVNMETLLNTFSLMYDYLYENNDQHPHFQLAIDLFDHGDRGLYRPVVAAFTAARCDFIASDREAAAFILALYAVARLPLPGEKEAENEYAEKHTAPETEKNDQPENAVEKKAAEKRTRRIRKTSVKETADFQYDKTEKDLMPVWYYTPGKYYFSVPSGTDVYEKKNHIIMGDPANTCTFISEEYAENTLLKMDSAEAERIKEFWKNGYIVYREEIKMLYELHVEELTAAKEAARKEAEEKKSLDYSTIDSEVKDRIINSFMHGNITAEEMRNLLEEAYAAAACTEKTIMRHNAASALQGEKNVQCDTEHSRNGKNDCRASYTLQEADGAAGNNTTEKKDPTVPHYSRKPEYMNSS